jgi:hypothetical protein
MNLQPTIDWQVEQDKFMAVAFHRCDRASRRAFERWHSRKRDDAVQEAQVKMWDQWARLLIRGDDPAAMIGPLIHWAILWVRYDRKVAGRGRNPDVYDYRAGMTRQDLDGQGKAHPSERSDPGNSWIDWAVDSRADDPAEMAAALEAVGLTSDDLANWPGSMT